MYQEIVDNLKMVSFIAMALGLCIFIAAITNNNSINKTFEKEPIRYKVETGTNIIEEDLYCDDVNSIYFDTNKQLKYKIVKSFGSSYMVTYENGKAIGNSSTYSIVPVNK